MPEQKIAELERKMDALLNLERAPSQFTVFLHLLGTGRTMTVREIASEIDISSKGVERAVAKLLVKGLIQRAPFRDGSYTCDSREILMGLLLVTMGVREKLEKLGS